MVNSVKAATVATRLHCKPKFTHSVPQRAYSTSTGNCELQERLSTFAYT